LAVAVVAPKNLIAPRWAKRQVGLTAMAAKPERSGSVKSGRAAKSLITLAVLAVGALLYVAREVFIPVALALLFSMILSGAVEWLKRKGVPRTAAAVLLMGILLGAVGVAVDFLIEPAQAWFVGAPRTFQVIERKISPIEKLVHRMQSLTQSPGQAGSAPANARSTAASPTEAPVSAASVMTATGSTLASLVTVVILTVFLLSGGPPMLARMTASLAANLQAANVLNVIEAIRSELAHYYGTIALINVGLGAATAIVMKLLGMPNPMLWGAIAALFNFVPYVGSATTLLLLTVVALVAFDTLRQVLAVVGSYLALATLEGQVVQPWLVGRRLDLNPVLVFLAVWFGGWFWGVAGIVIAVPALVALKVAASQGKQSSAIADFLSPIGSDTLKSIRGRVSSARARTSAGPARSQTS
jgi:predicted PurR-regulated permease PerM